MQVAGSARFIAYSLGTVVGILLSVYGFLALYAYLANAGSGVARLAFWGLIVLAVIFGWITIVVSQV